MKTVGLLLFGIFSVVLVLFGSIKYPRRRARAYFDHCAQLLDEMKRNDKSWPENSAALIKIAGAPPAEVGAQDFYSKHNDHYHFHFRWKNWPNGSCLTYRSYDPFWRYFNGPVCDAAGADNPKMNCDPNPIAPNCQVPFF